MTPLSPFIFSQPQLHSSAGYWGTKSSLLLTTSLVYIPALRLAHLVRARWYYWGGWGFKPSMGHSPRAGLHDPPGPLPAWNILWSCVWEEGDPNGICAKQNLRLPKAHLGCSKFALLPCFTRIMLILKARSAKQSNTDTWHKAWRNNGEIGYLVLSAFL